MEVSEFRQRLLNDDVEDLLMNILLSDDAKHVSSENCTYIQRRIAENFNIALETIQLIIVGSAKLGFSISEKKVEGIFYPRYRQFSETSDIDIAVVSAPLYELIWDELSQFSYSQTWFPWSSKKLGDYMVCGWLRPDFFPKHIRLRKCDDWWDTFYKLSGQRKFGRRRVRGGIFYNFEQLKRYQSRALSECIQIEKLNNEDSIK